MASTDSVIEMLNGLNMSELRRVVVFACSGDETQTTRNAIWSQCLAVQATRPAELPNSGASQGIITRDTPSLGSQDTVDLRKMLLEVHGALATLTYKVCTVHNIAIHPTVLSNTSTPIPQSLSSFDRERDLQLFARQIHTLLSRSKDVLELTSEKPAPPHIRSPSYTPYTSRNTPSSATWRRPQGSGWDKFHK